ncbi:MAG TPA: hypothetical protein ENO19_02670, partial [Halothiobacillaceae bacterium]|nr:hypothetical protein [Halothiobacillaceae bacterium]
MKPTSRRLFRVSALVVVVLLAGCASQPPIQPDPQFDAALPPEPSQHNPVQSNGAIFQTGQVDNMFADARPYRVGDILTVVLEERMQASKSAETSTILAAGVVEASGELDFQPGIEGRVRADGQLAHQRAGRQLGRRTARRADPVVDQPAAQVGGVDPFGHRGIVALGDQQREAEIVQQALGGAFPVALVLVDLDQFAGERQVVLGQVESGAEAFAHRQHPRGNVRAPLAQRGDLLGQLVVFALGLAQAHAVVGQPVVQRGHLVVEGRPAGVDGPAVVEEDARFGGRGQVDGLAQ